METKNHFIKNFNQLATSKERKLALEIVETGFAALDTTRIIENNFNIKDGILKIKCHTFDLTDFKNIYLIGLGKCACDAALAIKTKLGKLIKAGVVIDIKSPSDYNNSAIKFFKGTHPKPSIENVKASEAIVKLSESITGDDLVLIIVSGGGSALLCSSEKEYEAGRKIYETFLSVGGTIDELNTLRKHISDLKGGGLAKRFFPATLVSLIFSDVPSGNVDQVASGPTFKDRTTLEDVNKILEKYQLTDLKNKIEFFETPKDDQYFEKSYYILMASNVEALNAMRDKAIEFKLDPKIISVNISDKVEDAARMFTKKLNNNEVLLGGGEVKVALPADVQGKGGRNCHLTLEAAQYLQNGAVFISVASDGMDNSEAAGAIADFNTLKKISEQRLDYQKEKNNFNSFNVFKAINDLIVTEPTGSNVADLMVALHI